MYAIIYYRAGEILPYPYTNGDPTSQTGSGSLVIFNTIEDADNAAFTLEDQSHGDIDCVVISIAPVNENAQD